MTFLLKGGAGCLHRLAVIREGGWVWEEAVCVCVVGGFEGELGQSLINHRWTVLARKKCRARRNSARRLTFKRGRATAEII